MPCLLIRTNKALGPAEKQQLMAKGPGLVANSLGKSERYVMTSMECDVAMLFGARMNRVPTWS